VESAPFAFTVPGKVTFNPELVAVPVTTVGTAEGVKLRTDPELEPFAFTAVTL
jgi:hypothetical protein